MRQASTGDSAQSKTNGTATGEEISLDLTVNFTAEGQEPATLTGELAFLTLEIIDLAKAQSKSEAEHHGKSDQWVDPHAEATLAP